MDRAATVRKRCFARMSPPYQEHLENRLGEVSGREGCMSIGPGDPRLQSAVSEFLDGPTKRRELEVSHHIKGEKAAKDMGASKNGTAKDSAKSSGAMKSSTQKPTKGK